jgi:hypothetical protein
MKETSRSAGVSMRVDRIVTQRMAAHCKFEHALSKPTSAPQQRQTEQRQHERHEQLEAAVDARVAQQMS